MRKSLTITNDIGQLVCLNEFLHRMAGEFELEESVVMNLKLAVEEAVVNIISYAYPGKKDEKIQIEVTYASKRITVVITDSGIPFDPTAGQEPDLSLPLEERPIGGLGTYLVRQLMTDVHYARSGNKNILTMIKYID